MIDSPEAIRQQIETTKSQLWEKLDTLENQVSDAVLSTSTAVSETVASVQETFSNVTESVHESVQSVSNAFDLPLQVRKHPWLTLGGSFVIGYLAREILDASIRVPDEGRRNDPQTSESIGISNHENGRHSTEATRDAASQSNLWAETKGMLAGVLMTAVSAIVARSVPAALDYLAQNLRADPNPNEDPVAGSMMPRTPK